MSLTDVRPYFRTRLEALSYIEHTDSFNFENIPETRLEQVYHLQMGDVAAEPANHQTHRYFVPVTVRVFKKGYRSMSDAVDDAMVLAQNILAEVLLITNRVSSDIKDVRPTAFRFEPLGLTNDTAIMLELDFNSIIIEVYR